MKVKRKIPIKILFGISLFLAICASWVLLPTQTLAKSQVSLQKSAQKNVHVKYRQYSEVDLSGATVQGKIRNPAVFYIFQRKRSESPSLVRSPRSLDYHHELTHQTLKETLKGILTR